jgi:hypothetical protein
MASDRTAPASATPAPAPYGTHEYAGTAIDFDALPVASRLALLRRGLAHYLGNEQAAKVSAHKAKNEGIDEAALGAFKSAAMAAALEALRAGTLGAGGPRGPRGTPIEQTMRNIAEKEVRAILKGQNLSMPTGDKTLEFPNGAKLTRADLIDRRLANAEHGPRIRKLAEAEHKAAERLGKGAVGADLEVMLG